MTILIGLNYTLRYKTYMLTTSYSASLQGIDGYIVTVECNSSQDIPIFDIVGLPDAAVKEAKQRVRAAMTNSDLAFPDSAIIVNLAPADIKKEGCAFDLAIFIAILKTAGTIPEACDLTGRCFIGELSFSGALRRVPGILSMVIAAKEAGFTEVFVPKCCGPEAAAVEGISIYAADDAVQIVRHLQGLETLPKFEGAKYDLENYSLTGCNFSDVRGQERAKRALEIAAAGGHNVLMIGPPGAGKSMLARRLPTILPPMCIDDAVETTKIHSVAGILKEGTSLVCQRPFRSPHHTMSIASLVGGGARPKPGEVSAAHNGVLFLDELPEFPKNVIEGLRQPLEDGEVTITRAAGKTTYPSRFMLVCAMNPCKCGYFGSQKRKCTCRREEIRRYLAKVSGPLLDRIDIQIEIPALEFSEISDPTPTEDSSVIRTRVIAARTFAAQRFNGEVSCNANMTAQQVRQFCTVDPAGNAILENAFEKFGMSARGHDRVLKVARTIADLDHSETIRAAHIAEAVQLRSLDRKYW